MCKYAFLEVAQTQLLGDGKHRKQGHTPKNIADEAALRPTLEYIGLSPGKPRGSWPRGGQSRDLQCLAVCAETSWVPELFKGS